MMCESYFAPGLTRRVMLQQLIEDISDHIYFKDTAGKGLLRVINSLSPQNLSALINGAIISILRTSGLETFRDDVCLIGIEYHTQSEF